MESAVNIPSFIGIGAQKCASTWLYDILEDHPQAVLSARKELDFFSYNYTNGYQWYRDQFPTRPGVRQWGEVSPSYFHEPAVPERVYRFDARMRMVLFLRDPFERAVSNHRHAVKLGHLHGDDVSFERGLANNPTYVDQGLYAEHLARWFAHFPREQFLVLLFDEVLADPLAVARRVYRFLDLDPTHTPAALGDRSNASYLVRSRPLDEVRRGLRLTAARVGLGGAWEWLARRGVRTVYRRLNRLPSEARIPPVSPEVRRRLYREVFAAEIDRLERMLDVTLDAWRVPG